MGFLDGCGSAHEPSKEKPNNETSRSSTGAKFLTHEVVVKRDPEVSEAAFQSALEDLGGNVVDADSVVTEELGYYRVVLPVDVTVDEAISELIEAGVAEQAERNYVVEAFDLPNDPSYGQLWGLSKISASKAWDLTHGSSDIIVAVTDTGIDRNHPDLRANMWINPGEIAGNSRDDDGNGYIDDLYGWDFNGNDFDPSDDNGHGSHCAGTIGASGNDGVGVVGVNWRVKLQAAKMLAANGSGSLWAGAQAITYAARNGARVVNASWGCAGCDVSYVSAAIQELGNRGGLFVAAAGNASNNNDAAPFYPAGYNLPNVISVAATGQDDRLASFSNYGANSVHVAAPGVGILSTTPNNGYSSYSGTSMAAPHVAGTAALLLARKPALTGPELKDRLMSSTVAVSALSGRVKSGGRIDAYGLLGKDDSPPAAPTALMAIAGTHSDIALSWTAPPDTDVVSYVLRWGMRVGDHPQSLEVRGATEVALSDLIDGQAYYFVVEAVDAGGNHGPVSDEATAIAVDDLAPPQVIDLAVVPQPSLPASADVTSSSGEFSEFYRGRYAADGDPHTSWITPPRPSPQEESLVLELHDAYVIDRVVLTPSDVYPELFPVDFELEVSQNGSAWTPVTSRRDAEVPEEPLELAFAAIEARMVRLRITRSAEHESGFSYVALGEIEVLRAAENAGHVDLTFRAPGDDPGQGRAARYDLRASTGTLTVATFSDAEPVDVPGEPQLAGRTELVGVDALRGETTYSFALIAIDEAENRSAMSNVATTTTPRVPPAPVLDLSVSATGPDWVELQWTATGADGHMGQAESYELRRATTSLDAGGFAFATPVEGVPAPASAGSIETFTVHGLERGTLHYFALQVRDSAGNESGVSNVASAFTQDGPDTIPPATVHDLTVFASRNQVKLRPSVVSASSEQSPAARMLDGVAFSTWASSTTDRSTPQWVVLDLGELVPLTRVRMQPSSQATQAAFYPSDVRFEVGVDGFNWQPFVDVQDLRGRANHVDEWGSDAVYARYLRVYVSEYGPGDCNGNSCTSGHAEIGELELYARAQDQSLDITWIAPGDDGFLGTATRYDLRYASTPITEASFEQATAFSAPLPQPAGAIELAQLQAPSGEGLHYVALRAIDEAGNVSGISNQGTFTTPGVPPAAVVDLTATHVSTTEVTLGWTASGDDGTAGTATRIDLRYATAPITPANWDDCESVSGVAAPLPSGTAEGVTVRNLASNTIYYFALQVIDDEEQASLLSNLIEAETADGIAPAMVTDLVAAPVDASNAVPLALGVRSSSGAYSSQTGPEKMLDGRADTQWMSQVSTVPTSAWVIASVPRSTRLSRLRMRAGSGFNDLFPRDLSLEARTGNGAWSVVLADQAITTSGSFEEWSLGSVLADEVRLTVSATAPYAGRYYAAVGELELYADTSSTTALRLTWTAPGDDGREGRARSYDLRSAATQITNAPSFAAATPVATTLTPSPAGSLERLEVGGLVPEQRYCFGLTATDDNANASSVAGSNCVNTPGLPPSVVTDLVATARSATGVELSWSAPGGDGSSGRASAYELRVSDRRIHSGNWGSATVVTGLPIPAAVGAAERFTVTGLRGLTGYFFALRAIDAQQLAGGISNNARATTLDDVPPGTVSDLSVQTDSAQLGTLTVRWTAPGDNGPVGTATSYDLRVSTTAITAQSFASATRVQLPAPRAAGQSESAALTGLAAETVYYVALRMTDAAGNVSALSNVASGSTRQEPPAAVDDLNIIAATGDRIGDATLTLRWTAPGDDGRAGRATRYDVRYTTRALDASNFTTGTVATAPAPATAGSSETLVIAGLSPDTLYYVALKTVDDRGNESPISNNASFTTPDRIAPSAITDLRATAGANRGQIELSWTAPGDDAAGGTAAAYDVRYALSPITANNFAAATALSGPPRPGAAGTAQRMTANGLPDETAVYFAVRTTDNANNSSAISNPADARSQDVAPSRPTISTRSATVTSITIGWIAPGDDGAIGTAAAYDLRYSTATIIDATFAQATPAIAPAPAVVGTSQSAVIEGLQPNTTYSIALRARDERNNGSPLSNVLVASTLDNVAPAAITDLRASTGSASGTLSLQWTAPGDDGSTGRATRYEVRCARTAVNAGNWSAASVIANPPSPRTAGSAESFLATGLANETRHHCAVVAFDEANNQAAVSNSADADAPPEPPARVLDLVAVAQPTGVALTFTAPGDDNRTGTATRYEIRYATSAITAATFANATLVSPLPSPSPANTVEHVDVTGLLESTTYWFALIAVDDVGAASQLSNVVQVRTVDLTAPGAPTSLAVSSPQGPGRNVPLVSATASSELGLRWGAGYVLDEESTTSWSSSASALPTTQTLVVRLGSHSGLDQLQLMPDAAYLSLFPRAFVLELSTDGTRFTRVAEESGFSAGASQWLSWGFPTAAATHARITITEMGESYGNHFAIIAGLHAVEAMPSAGVANLTWIAPGDDGSSGRATSYEVYQAESAFDAGSLNQATRIAHSVTPGVAGALDRLNLTTLRGEARYYFALRAVDEANNVGPLSNVVSTLTNTVAPSPVTDLTVTALDTTRVRLSWTATGDDASQGRAARYELRYATGTLTSQSFALATRVTSVPTPGTAGTRETLTVEGLAAGTDYRFALLVLDDVDAASHLSNVARATTVAGPDTTPPRAITDLQVSLPDPGGMPILATLHDYASQQPSGFPASAVLDGDADTMWVSEAHDQNTEEFIELDLGEVRERGEVYVWPSAEYLDLFPSSYELRVSPDGLSWTRIGGASHVTAQSDQPAVAAWVNLPTRYVAFVATELAHHANGHYYAAASEIAVFTATEDSGSVVISWTAPGDDGANGQASAYELSVSACPFDAAHATAIITWAPLASGTPERVFARGISAGERCFDVVAIDEVGLRGAASNRPLLMVP